jgi:hypothetical protein
MKRKKIAEKLNRDENCYNGLAPALYAYRKNTG